MFTFNKDRDECMRKVTLRDVAKEAGVALSTASNALNDSDVVTDSTKEKVMEAAEKLNYFPNINAKLIKAKKSNRLAFITTSINGDYYEQLLQVVVNTVAVRGYQLDVIITENKDIVLSRMLEGSYDGFIIIGQYFLDKKQMQTIKNNNIACVFLDRNYVSENTSSVLFKSFEAGYDLTKYLINLGHKNIVFVEYSKEHYDSNERKRGYFKALDDYGLERDENLILTGRFDEHLTYSAVLNFMKTQAYKDKFPTAFICGNDRSAIGAMRALKNLAYEIPREISVAGFDNIELAKYINPSLTTIKNPISEQGKYAAIALMDMIDKNKSGYLVELDCELIIRESTGVVNSNFI